MAVKPAPLSTANGAGNGRTKVAVLGGGIGGLTAAFELTRQGGFDVTVYQLGWRLGGKGASGRNMELGARIEEHGLHVWFGFYANAFALMRDVYEELGRPDGAPLATIEKAFTPCDQIVLYDLVADRWHPHPFRFPRIGSEPWSEQPELPTFWQVALDAVVRARRLLASLDEPHVRESADADDRLAEAEALAAAHVQKEGLPARGLLDQFVKKLREACESLRERWEEKLAGPDAHPRVRMVYTTIDAFTAMAAGIVADGLLEKGFQWVDGRDWTAWLRQHGASQHTAGDTFEKRAPVLRSLYDVAFCFPKGDIEKASAAAGTATSNLLRLQFTYRGAISYKMLAGMGDAVFAPLYEVLRSRGVKFRFFHAVTRLGLSRDGERVETIDVVPQAQLRVSEYNPLVCVKRLPCWPSEPVWDQLEEVAKSCGTRFETELNPLRRPAETLTLGTDFHHVVLAIPVGALDSICSDLMERKQCFREMVECSETVQTQAFQLWTLEPPERLGCPYGADSVVSSYVEPLDTYCDMEHLLKAECWSEKDGVNGVAYFCGVLKESSPSDAAAQAKKNARDYLSRDLGRLWPGALTKGPGSPLRDDVLADRQNRKGLARLDAQYVRANVACWERYVITPAGSVAKRLPSDCSGFANLVLAGDWTRTAISGGCVEAAVMSGMQAARKLTGLESTIVGESPTWLTP